jgi:hypothetical protein
MAPKKRVTKKAKLAHAAEEISNSDIICDECPICLDPLIGFSRILPCSHVIHELCLYELATFSDPAVCPMCRANLPTRRNIMSLPMQVHIYIYYIGALYCIPPLHHPSK